MKTWSYKQITEEAEREIAAIMEAASKEEIRARADVMEDWAYGVFLGWNSLTLGWREEGERDRMESLTRRSNKPDATTAQ